MQIPENKMLFVRVCAALRRSGAPCWQQVRQIVTWPELRGQTSVGQ